MTDAELIAYYANLLILQYLEKPKAYATIQTVVTPVIMNQLPLAVQNAYNLTGETGVAVGVQLDVLGKYAGVSRTGFGFSGPITLSDSDFLILIQLAIITNSSGSSLSTIQALLAQFFPGEVLVFDYQNMQMNYLISSTLGSQDLIQLFVTEGLLPKPMGVQLAAVIYAADLKFFGMLSAGTVATYAAQNALTIDQAANALLVANNIWQLNSVAAPILGQWLSAKQGVL